MLQPSDWAWASSFLISSHLCSVLLPASAWIPLTAKRNSEKGVEEEEERGGRGGGTGMDFYSSLVSKWGWMTRGMLLLPLCVVTIPSVFLSLVSTSPWHFYCFVWYFSLFWGVLYLNLYLLFRLLLNLSVISKWQKIDKKNTKCLKILYRHRF